MNNRVNIIAVILAVAVFVGIIVYSQSNNESAEPVTPTPEEEVEITEPTPAPAAIPTSSIAPAPKQNPAPVISRTRPAATSAPAVSTASVIGADLLVANAQMSAMRTNSPDQYAAQLTKLSAALSALKLNANDARAWIMLGEVAEDFGKSESAERSYLKSIEVDPSHGGWNHLGTIYLSRASYVQAIWAYEGLLQYHPEEPQAVSLLQNAKALAGR